ncbi:MAG TPA: 2Fe-2S iron-sulfur cluster-binding protein [Polyangiaceae bacterium]|nr:2Fe-2S iron-sulfur cluster-binding protein [Polyangiaceae bacterium]
MPRIEFLASEFGPAKVFDAPSGGELLDMCDEVRAPIPFSCRSASCATCEVEVVEGMELLETPEPVEQELLDILGAPEDHRLACQVKVKAERGVVRIKPAG